MKIVQYQYIFIFSILLKNISSNFAESSKTCINDNFFRFNPRYLANPVYSEETVASLDHVTPTIQTIASIDFNLVMLSELSGVSNPSTTDYLVQVDGGSSYDQFIANPNPLNEPSCESMGNIVRSMDYNIFFIRMTNSDNTKIVCANNNNTFKIYYYVWAGSQQPPKFSFSSDQLLVTQSIYNIKIINFQLQTFSPDIDSTVMINYTDQAKTLNYFAIAYIPLGAFVGFSANNFYSYPLTSNTADYLFTTNGFFIGITNNFAFLYVKTTAAGKEVDLKILKLDNTITYPDTVITTVYTITSLTCVYDNIRNLAYAVISSADISGNKISNFYILQFSLPTVTILNGGGIGLVIVGINNITEIIILGGNSKSNGSAVQCSYCNFILLYGSGIGTAVPSNTSIVPIANVYKIDLLLNKLNLFSTMNFNIIGLNQFKGLKIAMYQPDVIYNIRMFPIYTTISQNEKLTRTIPCMFFTMPSACQLSCNTDTEGEDLVNRTCVKCINNVAANKTKLYNNQCVELCPYGWPYNVSGKCYQCPPVTAKLNLYMDVASNSCISQCTKDKTLPALSLITDALNKVCMNCLKMGQFKRTPSNPTQCVASCQIGDVIDSASGVCYACKQNGLFYHNTNCLVSCPQYSTISDTSTNTCTVCPDIGKLFNEGVCVDVCPPGKMVRTNTPECVTCQSLGFLNNFGTCANVCQANSGSDASGNCQWCQDMGLFVFESLCVEICPYYNVKDSLDFCVPCSLNNTFYVNNGGTVNCLIHGCTFPFVSDESNICYECYTRGLFYFEGKCLTQCPPENVWDEKNMCNRCPKGTYYDTGVCKQTCSSFTFSNTTSVCYHCQEIGKYMLIDRCVDDCPDFASKVEFYNYCDPCYLSKNFYYNGTCTPFCPSYSWVSENNKCERCKDKRTFYYNNTCVDQCPNSTYVDYIGFFCSDHQQIKEFTACLNGGVLDPLTNSFCKCENGFSGYLCQYSAANVTQITTLFESMLIFPVTFQGSRISSLYDSNYLQWVHNYIAFVEEVNFVYSDNIFSDLHNKLSYLTRYEVTQIWNKTNENFMLFDSYISLIQSKYLNFITSYLSNNTSVITSTQLNNSTKTNSSLGTYSSSSNITNSTNKTKLRNLLINLMNDREPALNNSAMQYFVNQFIILASNSFSGVKIQIDSLIKSMIGSKKSNTINFVDGAVFKLNTTILGVQPNNTESNLVLVDTVDTNSTSTSNNTSTTNTTTTTTNNTLKIRLLEFNYKPMGFVNSWYNVSLCEQKIRSTYSLTSNDPIYVYSTEYSADINYDTNRFQHISNSLSLQLVHPKLGIRSKNSLTLCQGAPVSYYLNLVSNPAYNDLINLYHRIYNATQINILDKNDLFFSNRCYRYAGNSSFSSLTLRQRKIFYFYNLTSQCVSYKNFPELNSLCHAKGITSDNFAQCDCQFIGEVLNGIFHDFLPIYSKYNFDVISCAIEVFKYSSDYLNYGNYLTLSVFLSNFLFRMLYFYINKKLLSHHLAKVIKNDCITLDFDENLFPSFLSLTYNTNIKSFQYQYENTVLNQLKFEMSKGDLFKLDRLKHFQIENNELSKDKNESAVLAISSRRENKSCISNNMWISDRVDKRKVLMIKHIREKYFNRDDIANKNFTLMDLDCMDAVVRLDLDKRTHLEYFRDYLLNYNMIGYAIFKKSLLIPQSFRLMVLSLYILCYSFFNAFFYFENLIEDRSVTANQNSIIYTLTHEYTKLIIAYLSTTYLMLLFKLLLKIPKGIFLNFNILLWTIDNTIINDGNFFLNRHLFITRNLARLVYIFIGGLSVLYCTVFCAVYSNCVMGWLYSVGICVSFDFVVVEFFLIPPLALFSRILAKKFKSFACIYFILEALTVPNKI